MFRGFNVYRLQGFTLQGFRVFRLQGFKASKGFISCPMTLYNLWDQACLNPDHESRLVSINKRKRITTGLRLIKAKRICQNLSAAT